MLKFDITRFAKYEELPFEEFDGFNYGVYVMSCEWDYKFVNQFVKRNLGDRGRDLIGKNMWTHFRELGTHPSFMELKQRTERGLSSQFITISPLTNQRMSIFGQPLSDCYYFSSSVLPNKEDLISDLRQQLKSVY